MTKEEYENVVAQISRQKDEISVLQRTVSDLEAYVSANYVPATETQPE